MRRVLYEFPHSHFCEVARWALEHKQLPYRSQPLLPGYHAHRMRRLGCRSSLPVLDDGGTVVQGSGAILDYLDERYPEVSLVPDADAGEVQAFEREVATAIGVPLRRLCYVHLLARPDLVRYFFMHRSGPAARLAFRALYPIMRGRLVEAYDCTPAGGARAERELEDALDRYDRRLEGRAHVFGDRFSRADLTFAALLVFMVMPPEFPVRWPAELAEHRLGRWFAAFAERPSYAFVARTYRDYRPRPA